MNFNFICFSIMSTFSVINAALSPDGSCGGANQYTCSTGNCCSRYGFCGSSADFCDAGCQNSFGSCGTITSTLATTSAAPSPSSSAAPSPSSSSTSAVKLSPDGSCGGSTGFTCTPGNCCSQYGFCGNSADFCGAGCQSAFGTCSGSPPPISTTASPSSTPVSTSASPSPTPSSGGAVTSIQKCVSPGMFALTFDDGPLSDSTNSILNTLKNRGVKATFFIVGEMLGDDTGKASLKRELTEGHEFGSHSFNHPDFSTLSSDAQIKQHTDTAAAIFAQTGQQVKYFRFPYGSETDSMLAYLGQQGMSSILWSMDTQDWALNDSAKIQAAYVQALNAANSATDSFIALNHDINAFTAANLDNLITLIASKGYRFVSMSECTGKPAFA